MTGLDRCRNCDKPVGEGWNVCPFCETRLANGDGDDQGQELAADGGEPIPQLIDWAYDAVVHGADVDRDCLALTGSGKPCSYNAYASNDLPVCNTHADVDDPELVIGAHQWARITDGDTTIAVCVNCEQVWRGGTPALGVDCPECGVDAGDRCRDETSRHSAPLPPHPQRRRHAMGRVDDYERCPAGPGRDVDDDQKTLVTDGGVEVEGGETVAAERITGPECQYEDCDAEADWLVELEHGGARVGTVCCQPCSETNRLYAHENDLYQNDVSDTARDTVDVDFEITWVAPEEMSVAGLRAEYQDLAEDVWGSGVSHDPEYRRLEALWDELRDRAGVEQPQCPKCGARNWAQTPGDPKYCRSCDFHPTEDHMELIQAIDEAWERILSPDAETDGGRDLNYRIRIDAPDHPIQFIKLVDMVDVDDKLTWNRRSEPVTVVAVEEEGAPEKPTPFRKVLFCENRARSDGERYRLTFEEGRDVDDPLAPFGSTPPSCVVQMRVADGDGDERWGPTADVEVLANVTPIQSIEGDENDEPELRADGGVGEDLDDADDHGVPNGEGKDLGDTWGGADDATAARRALLNAVDEHADETENGARAGTVIDTAIDATDAELRIVLQQLRLLHEDGQIYESDQGVVARTLADGGEIPPADLDVGGLGMTFRGPGGADGGDQT